MDWNKHFAQRVQWMRRNTVREFLKLAGQPGIISLAGGLPDSSLLPVEELRNATERTLSRVGSKALQYGPSEGIEPLREMVAGKYSTMGVSAENVLITSGSQQALDLIGRVLLNPADLVGVQNPTYLAALSAWSPYGVRFCDLKDRELSELRYAIPNFCNPSGETMTLEEREDLLERAGQSPLVEDDAYGELRFEGERLPSIFEIAGQASGPVIHVGTFSKILAPGLRVGWIIGARDLIAKLVQARQAADLHTSTFTQYVAWEAVQHGVIENLGAKLRDVYRQKRDAMLEALAQELPDGASWSRPEGGMFIMVRLTEGQDGRAVAAKALERKVLVVPGEEFHIRGGSNTLRLNFSHPSLEEIGEGVKRLGEVVRSFGCTDQKMPSFVQ